MHSRRNHQSSGRNVVLVIPVHFSCAYSSTPHSRCGHAVEFLSCFGDVFQKQLQISGLDWRIHLWGKKNNIKYWVNGETGHLLKVNMEIQSPRVEPICLVLKSIRTHANTHNWRDVMVFHQWPTSTFVLITFAWSTNKGFCMFLIKKKIGIQLKKLATSENSFHLDFLAVSYCAIC